MTRLDSAAWPEIASAVQSANRENVMLALVPLGSTEQHGAHLPFSTDTDIAIGVAERVQQLLSEHGMTSVITPALAFGSSGEHQSFPGTISLGTEALTMSLIELVRSATTWCQRILFVNGHGGNLTALSSAVSRLIREGHSVAWVACDPPSIPTLTREAMDAHAGRLETSLMLALRPSAVALSKAAPGNTEPLAALLADMQDYGVGAVSSNGVLGNPSGASAEEGRALVAALVEQIRDRVVSWHVDERGQLSEI